MTLTFGASHVIIAALIAVAAMFATSIILLKSFRHLRKFFVVVNALFLVLIVLCCAWICADNIKSDKIAGDEYTVEEGNILFDDYTYGGVTDGNVVVDVHGYSADDLLYPADSVRIDDNVRMGSHVRVFTDKEMNMAVRVIKDNRWTAIIGIVLTIIAVCLFNAVFFVVVLVKKIKDKNTDSFSAIS